MLESVPIQRTARITDLANLLQPAIDHPPQRGVSHRSRVRADLLVPLSPFAMQVFCAASQSLAGRSRLQGDVVDFSPFKWSRLEANFADLVVQRCRREVAARAPAAPTTPASPVPRRPRRRRSTVVPPSNSSKDACSWIVNQCRGEPGGRGRCTRRSARVTALPLASFTCTLIDQLITVASASRARIMSGLSAVLAPGKLDIEAAINWLRHLGSVDQRHSSQRAAPYL